MFFAKSTEGTGRPGAWRCQSVCHSAAVRATTCSARPTPLIMSELIVVDCTGVRTAGGAGAGAGAAGGAAARPAGAAGAFSGRGTVAAGGASGLAAGAAGAGAAV